MGEEEIRATANHPVYVKGKGWRAAEEVEVGDFLVTREGKSVRVEKVEKEELEEAAAVYNLEVEDFHTYYVSGKKVLVHNKYGSEGGKETVTEVIMPSKPHANGTEGHWETILKKKSG